MKILIVARHFGPENTIGAVRSTKFAKYLARMGHDVTVYACAPEVDVSDALLADDIKTLRIYRITNGVFYRAVHDFFAAFDRTRGNRPQKSAAKAQPAERGKRSFLPSIFQLMYRVMWVWCDRDFTRRYRACTRADRTAYDAIFSSWNTNCSHDIALDLMKRGRAKRWVADFRDAYLPVFPKLAKNRDAERFLSRVYARADAVTAAFPSVLADNRVPQDKRAMVLFNGFDPEDLARIESAEPADGLFRIAYCGQIYDKQDFSPVFRAVAELCAEGLIDKTRVALDYAGQSADRFLSQAAAAGLAERVRDHGFLPRQEALALEKRARVLLFAAWSSDDKPAIFPAKFLEYMMMDRPVVCAVAGERGGSLPAEVVARARLGVCAEETGGEADYGALKRYLSEQYARFAADEAPLFDPDREYIARFSYPNLARTLEKLLKGGDGA